MRLLLSLSALGAPLLVATSGWAKDYYVAPAPAGDDANAGTQDAPFASMAKAQSVAMAGDAFYFKGGTYTYTAGTTTCASGTATVSGVVLNKSGSAGKLIKYWAAPGEKPVFDFDGIRDSCRIKGILVSGNYIHLKGLEIKGVRQNNNLNHESWGVWNQGSNNVFEALDVHHIMGAGIFIQRGSNNLVLNCDSHDNFDELTSNGAGESADGFGCHVGAGETGNVFRGCRAWWNADDGYDFINSGAACLVEHSWAWYNGYKPGTLTGIGNGNGFKGGGYGADPAKFPAKPAAHTVQNCLAVSNRAAGFYANHHPSTLYFYNNTSCNNRPDFNMLGMDSNGNDITVGVYRNNLAFGGTLFSNRNDADDANNSWTAGGVTVSNADFQNPSEMGLDAPRQADGSLPALTNFHLASDSDTIDKGVDVGLPYAGSAPDFGCFERGLDETAGASGAGGAGSAGSGSGGTEEPGSGGASASGGAASGGATSGGAASGGATSGGATSGSATSVGSGGGLSTGSGGTSPSSADDSAGCACSTLGGDRPGAASLALVNLVLWCFRARRRRRVTSR
ncbi:right-handed parallel beta-helix repeat-containing protein [Sorangium sp. So ce1000]|uniref:right-handed parallel beta-helix repeat-containing protein n=1 Tax=Sorangium sp. So ce1000 TaxID=3133325 RepID=UPI003F6103E0